MVLNLLRNGKFGTFFAGRVGKKNMAIFHYLTESEVLKIAGFLMRDMTKQFKKEGYDLKVAKNVLQWAVDTGYQKNLGARGVREKIENVVGPEVGKALLYGRLAGKNPKQFAVVIRNNDIKVVSDVDPEWRKISKEAGY